MVLKYLSTYVYSQFDRARKATCENPSDVCCRKDTSYNKSFGPTSQPLVNCGRRGSAPRISGVLGEETPSFGEWPHMCIILRHSEHNGEKFDLYQCGASLISPGIVLTAAHCVEYVNWITKEIILPSIT